MGQFHDPFSHEGIFRLSEGVSALSRLPSHRLLNIRLAFPWCNMYVMHPHAKTPAHAKILNLLSYLPFAQGCRGLTPLCPPFLSFLLFLLFFFLTQGIEEPLLFMQFKYLRAKDPAKPLRNPCATPAQSLLHLKAFKVSFHTPRKQALTPSDPQAS